MRISVGVPAYNNESTIGATIESILAQTIQNIEIIISDDGSSDKTWEICCEYKEKDNRIKLFKQKRNLYYMNFLFVLNQAKAPYFSWLAGDDTWSPTYLEECLSVLETKPDVVGCVARCRFVVDGQPVSYATGTTGLEGDWPENVSAFLREPGDNTRMYGLFRVEALRAAFPDRIMHAYDWALSAATLKFGKHVQLSNILMTRNKTPIENYVASVRRDHRSRIFHVFPVLPMTLYLILFHEIPFTFKVISALISINYKKHEEYVRLIHPKIYKKLSIIYRFIDKYVIWRL